MWRRICFVCIVKIESVFNHASPVTVWICHGRRLAWKVLLEKLILEKVVNIFQGRRYFIRIPCPVNYHMEKMRVEVWFGYFNLRERMRGSSFLMQFPGSLIAPANKSRENIYQWIICIFLLLENIFRFTKACERKNQEVVWIKVSGDNIMGSKGVDEVLAATSPAISSKDLSKQWFFIVSTCEVILFWSVLLDYVDKIKV